MGAYKDKNGVTRAGKVLRDIGGFFSGIFKKKSTSTSTDTSNTSTNTGGATPPISGSSSKFDWGGLLVTLGTAVGGIFGVNTPTSDTNTTTDTSGNGSDPNNNGDASAKSLGTWVVVGIVSLVAGILIYVLYRKKAKA